MAKFDLELELTPEQEAEAQRIEAILVRAAGEELRQMARLMASKKNCELLGEAEFRVRDLAHRIGAKAVEAAVNERSKKGIPGC